MTRISVAQIGARRRYAIPRALHDEGLLDTLYTDLAANGPLVSWLPMGTCMDGRRVAGVPSSHIRHYPFFGITRVMRRRKQADVDALTADYLRANQRFGSLVARSRMEGADAVYAFNGAALEIFKKARSLGMRTMLDQSSAPLAVEEGLLADERRRWPDWEEDVEHRMIRDVAARELEEWSLADLIVCGSDYVRSCVEKLAGLGDRCVVIPYGIEVADPVRKESSVEHDNVHVLYVGHARLLKGIQYFMEAAQRLKEESIQFRMVGKVQVSELARKQLADVMELVGPVPHTQVWEQYTWADVLVVPSLSEGSANVAYEALSCGLPVIATETAGTVVRDGVDGFIVPTCSGEHIAEALRSLLGDPKQLRRFSEHALDGASQITSKAYADRLVAVVRCFVESARG